MKSAGEVVDFPTILIDRPYLGQVVDNNSPSEDYKLKIRIYPFFQGVEDNNLPWIFPFVEESNTIRMLPEVNSWVWCAFRGDHMSPYWFAYQLTSQNGSYAYIREQADQALAAVDAEELTYPEFDILHKGDVFVILNKAKSEYVILVGGNALKVNASGIEVKTQGPVSIASAGQINIDSGLTSSIVLNGGVAGANDYPTCLFTGAPHCLDPLKRVKVP